MVRKTDVTANNASPIRSLFSQTITFTHWVFL